MNDEMALAHLRELQSVRTTLDRIDVWPLDSVDMSRMGDAKLRLTRSIENLEHIVAATEGRMQDAQAFERWAREALS